MLLFLYKSQTFALTDLELLFIIQLNIISPEKLRVISTFLQASFVQAINVLYVYQYHHNYPTEM